MFLVVFVVGMVEFIFVVLVRMVESIWLYLCLGCSHVVCAVCD